MNFKKLEINLNPRYSIYIGSNLFNNDFFIKHCLSLKKRFALISDHHVKPFSEKIKMVLQNAHLSVELISLHIDETNKTRETKQALEDTLLKKGYGRDSCFIVVGGGVVTDLVGFLAATYCRGIPCIYIPTTLLSMVDASIGGKTGVNTSFGKNLIGCFHQPHAVFIDIDALSTLPQKEWRNGFVEIIKHSLIADASLFSLLEHTVHTLKTDPQLLINVIYRSCYIKKTIVEQDEKELGLRQLLNCGHTIGHAIETIENYKLSHGEAVAIGLLVEASLAVHMKFLSEEALKSIFNLLHAYQLPLKTTAFQKKEKLLHLFKMDKKAIEGQARFVLLKEIGRAHHIHDAYSFTIDPLLLDHVLTWAAAKFI